MGEYSSLGDYVICYNIGGVRIGGHSTISQYSHLCSSTHDYEHPHLSQRLIPIEIEDQVWVCADAFIGPGVTVGQGAVVGARASVFKNVPPWTVVGGNPARPIKKRTVRNLISS